MLLPRKPAREQSGMEPVHFTIRRVVKLLMQDGDGFRPGLFNAVPEAFAQVDLKDRQAVHDAILGLVTRFRIRRGETA